MLCLRDASCFRMLENRVPHMLNNDYTPYSALDIFVKDMVRNNLFFPLYVSQEHCETLYMNNILRFILLIYFHSQGIVTRESSSLKVPLQLSTIVHQLYLSGSVYHFESL